MHGCQMTLMYFFASDSITSRYTSLYWLWDLCTRSLGSCNLIFICYLSCQFFLLYKVNQKWKWKKWLCIKVFKFPESMNHLYFKVTKSSICAKVLDGKRPWLETDFYFFPHFKSLIQWNFSFFRVICSRITHQAR